MPIQTVYVTIRATVEAGEAHCAEDICSIIAQECDYKVEHRDTECRIVDTELIDVTSEPGG
jgi:hypothetical protein